jgi:hypothetical protein
MIDCLINDTPIKLRPVRFRTVPRDSSVYRVVGSNQIKIGKHRCKWPWRYMESGQVVVIGYDLAPCKQVKNALVSYCRVSGAKFEYRKTAQGMKIFCIKQNNS